MYNDGRWAKQLPTQKYLSRLFVFSREAVLHGLRNIQKGHKKMEEKRKVRLTRSIAVLEREDAPLSL